MHTHGRHVLLIGMMGSGKTTTGRLLAERLGRPYVDSDEQVEALTGRSVAEIFAAEGEASFRSEERLALESAVEPARAAVVGVAGGAVLDPSNRRTIRSAGTVVWLRARPSTLAARVDDGAGRPLIAGHGAALPEVLERLDDERRALYAELADVIVDVDELATTEVVSTIASSLLRRTRVELGERSYDVTVGPGARHELSASLPPRARRAAVVTQEGVGVEVDPGIEWRRFLVGDGEGSKSLSSVEQLCRSFAAFGLTRHDVVIAVGGGLVTDLAGFAAASYHRGTAVVHVATTLLAQVDAAIGGKTGVNLPEGKNLVGAFWQPRAVLCDTDVVSSLPGREWRSGLGEMAKYAFLGVEDLETLTLEDQVARCVALKAAVVAADELEGGRRAVLNYGHTLAHALEAAGFADRDEPAAPTDPAVAAGAAGVEDASGVDLRHGEAVAIGIVFAARLAQRLGRIGTDRVRRHLEVVQGYGLPSELPPGVDPVALLALMGRDKKANGGLTFVLDGPNGVEVVEGVDRAVVFALLAESLQEAGGHK